MIRYSASHPAFSFAAFFHAITLSSVYCPGAAWGPQPASSFPKSLLPFQTEPSRHTSPKADEDRRHFLKRSAQWFVGITFTTADLAAAAETVGKDPDCDDLTCLGVWDGLLADCPHDNSVIGKFVPSMPGGGAGCTSSQDDTPGIFSEPWDYSESPINNELDYSDQMRLLRPTLIRVLARRGDKCEILIEKERYLRALITDGTSSERSVAEFYFTPNDTTVQFRIGSIMTDKVNGKTLLRGSSLRNIERGEIIRKELRYLKLPVLRNRKRSLFFVESDFDQFGPGSASLGPPAQMKSGEISGRLSDNVDPRLKIDAVQQFPYRNEIAQ
mmetsp:Transcript_3134/g.8488  ORF Transcript_3134/g.8488 Transcript_3134/m.8488 type:complete len:328 (-) Transcript_3134:1581-2564(-)